MRQESFERARVGRWREFEALLAPGGAAPGDADFPRLYRLVCQDLALARDRGFDTALVERLNALVLRGHQRFYGSRGHPFRPVEFLARRFPAAVRREGRLLLWMGLLFYGSAALFFWLDLREPSLIYALLSGEQVVRFEEMYDPTAEHYGAPRDTTGDFSAFAYYVGNNVGVAFRTFAWGLFFGIGSACMLLFNGVVLGLVAAHLTRAGFEEPFFSFVIGHGSFELTAIVLAGVCGAKLGGSLLAPGPRSRAAALRAAARDVLPLLYGLTAMLLIAAVFEAFWSSSHGVPPEVKLAVGAALWAAVAAWLGLGGRTRAH
jgi:uncharacterized membrane protein SpoIIM required for sporulation